MAYAFCALAPSAAMAFADGGAAHCLTDQQGIATASEHGGKAHVHTIASGTHHADDASYQPAEPDEKSRPGTCCGLFCVSAISVEHDVQLATPVTSSLDRFTLDAHIGGRGPDRINRPPIT